MSGLIFLALAYVLSQFYRSFMAVMTPALTGELGATKADLAFASGMWFLTFALMQFIVGISLDRYGPRRTVALTLGLFGGAGVFLFAAAWSPMVITIAMALIGVGCSAVLMGTFFLFARKYPPARFAFLASVFIGVGNMGNIIGASPMAWATETFGWRAVVAAIGVFTLIVAIAVYFAVDDPEQDSGAASSGLGGYGELLRIRNLWPLIPLTIVSYSAPAGIRGLWAGPFLADVNGADALTIGNVTFFMAVAMAAGSFLYGPLDTFFNTRKWVVATGTAVCLAGIAFLAMVPQSAVAIVTFALVVIGVSGMVYGVIMAHGRAFFPSHLIGRGVTLLNFFSIGGVALMQMITGRLVTAAEVPGEPAAAYSALFWFYAAVLGMALLVYVFSRDAKPNS